MAAVLSKLTCSYTQPPDQSFALVVSGQHAGKFLLVLVCVSFIDSYLSPWYLKLYLTLMGGGGTGLSLL